MSIVSPHAESVPTEVDPSRRWQTSIRRAIRCPHTLLRMLGLEGEVDLSTQEDFPVFVPREFLQRMRPGDRNDPLLLQVLPKREEDRAKSGFTADPLQEKATDAPGLIRKYRHRALLILKGACAVHCRYCFRREFPYADNQLGGGRWATAVDAVAADPQIEEVILSGGDPLMVADGTLAAVTQAISRVPHVRALRVHTRLPIVIPHRIESATVGWLSGCRLTSTVVIHANHARELDDQVAQAVQDLREGGIHVLNQSVLLKGVNDTTEALSALSWRLLEIGVVPYYLHQLDRVRGAAHFEVPLAAGLALVSQLRDELPGYAVPRYVVEEPGQPAKTVLL